MSLIGVQRRRCFLYGWPAIGGDFSRDAADKREGRLRALIAADWNAMAVGKSLHGFKKLPVNRSLY